MTDEFTKLFNIIESRKTSGIKKSYTNQLLTKGSKKNCSKNW